MNCFFFQFSDSITEPEAHDMGTNSVINAEANNVAAEESVLVESGPVEYDDHDQEYLDDEDDVHLSAAQLMGQQYGQGTPKLDICTFLNLA